MTASGAPPSFVPAPPVRWKRAKQLAEAALRSFPARLAVGAMFGSGVPFRGTRIRPASRFAVEGPLLLSGKYERAEIDFVHKHLPPGLQVLELGASIGGTSCQIARRLDPGVPITCVEANPELMSVLESNVRRNHPGRPVRLIHGMVAEATGEGTMQLQRSTLTSSGDGAGRSALVPALSIQDIVARLEPGHFSLVSDIEGAEVFVLAARPGVLDRCRCIIMEAHATAMDGVSRDVEQVLRMPADRGWQQVDRYGAVAVYVPGPDRQ